MPKARILVVDDEEGILEVCAEAFQKIPGAEVLVESDSRRAAQRLAAEHLDLLVADVCMPGPDGMALLRLARQRNPEMPVVLMTAFGSIEAAVQSVRIGAADYLTKPLDPAKLVVTARNVLEAKGLREENRWLRRHVQRPHTLGEILARSAAMKKVLGLIEKVAAVDVDVMIVGETGTGKELVAGAIHRLSARREGPFVPVNCGAIPEELIENEIFGHVRGAFTGAQTRGPGLLEIAQTGTFFLDELSQLPLAVQPAFLRVVQERTYRPVGGTEELPIDVRFITASSVDLALQVKNNRFREDLYHRLHVVQIDLPPLRDRPEDLPLLAEHFCGRYAKKMGKEGISLRPELMAALTSYSWPGNARELENMVKRMVALATEASLGLEDLPPELRTTALCGASSEFALQKHLRWDAFGKDYFVRLMTAHQGNVAAAAQAAGLHRWSVYRLLKKHGLNSEHFRPTTNPR